jgi:ABC-type multidrug transport system fused ATPase/permease subunit
MNRMKIFIKKYFKHLYWFYSYLGIRLFFLVFFSVILGFLDGIGLTMFLPFLQMMNGEDKFDSNFSENLNPLFDWLIENGVELGFYTPLLLMVFFFSIKGIAKFFSESYRANLQQSLLKKVRLDVLELLNNLSFKFFMTSDQGRIQNTLTGELDRIQQFFSHYFRVLESIILVVLYMSFAFYIDFKFAVVVSIAGLISNIIYGFVFKKTKQSSFKITRQNNLFQSQLLQQITNFKYLKATGFIEDYNLKLAKTVINIESSRKKIGVLNGILVAIREPLMILIIALVILIQVSILKGNLTPIILSLLFFYRALSALTTLQGSWNHFLSLSGSIENFKSLQKNFSVNQDKKLKKPFETFNSFLAFKDIHFSYHKKNILEDINFKIEKNKSIAITGESGSGKTTLVNILSGLLNADKGNINIDGTDLEEFDIKTYQKKIGYITQEPVIFNDTLFNNITLWDHKNDLNISKFFKVLSHSRLTSVINEMPLKEDTLLGDNGINLSGGQRQRISIARELYKDIEILILDEATSSLDSETELEIQNRIDSLKGNYTIIIIAHRLSTIKATDEIILLNKGRIEDQGHYTDLIKRRPNFKRMIEIQDFNNR